MLFNEAIEQHRAIMVDHLHDRIVEIGETQTDSEALLSQLTDDELTQMAQHIVVFRRLASPEARKMMHRYSTLVGEKTAHKVIEQCLAPGDKLAL